MACQSCGYNPCNCNNTVHSFNWNTVPNQSCDPCSTEIICKYTFPARCIMYNGPALTCLGLGSNVNLDVVIASIHSILCTLLDDGETCNAPSALEVSFFLNTEGPDYLKLQWIAGGGAVTSQRALRVAKVNSNTPSLTTTFSPGNDLSAVATITYSTDLQENTIYRYKVQSLCDVGDPVDNSNGVVENIVFACLTDDVINFSYATVGLTKNVTVTVNLPNPSPVDGGAILPDYTDLEGLVLYIYDAANTVQVKPPVTVNGALGVVSHTFTGLSASTTYNLRYDLIANIDGVDVTSADVEYLGGSNCAKEFTTSAL